MFLFAHSMKGDEYVEALALFSFCSNFGNYGLLMIFLYFQLAAMDWVMCLQLYLFYFWDMICNMNQAVLFQSIMGPIQQHYLLLFLQILDNQPYSYFYFYFYFCLYFIPMISNVHYIQDYCLYLPFVLITFSFCLVLLYYYFVSAIASILIYSAAISSILCCESDEFYIKHQALLWVSSSYQDNALSQLYQSKYTMLIIFRYNSQVQQQVNNLNMINPYTQSQHKLIYTVSSIKTLMLIVLLILILPQQSNSIQQLSLHGQLKMPNITTYKSALYDTVAQDNKFIAFIFPQINYEISSNIYIYDGYPSDDIIFDIYAYNRYTQADIDDENDDDMFDRNYTFDTEEYCSMYPTSIQANLRDQVYYTRGAQQVNPLKYTISTDPQKSKIFILTSQSTLLVYVFDKISLRFSQSYTIAESMGIITNKQLASNVQMLYLGEILYIFTNNKVYRLDQDSIVNHFPQISIQGVNSQQNNDTVVNVGIMNKQDNLIWVCRSRNVQTYKININNEIPTLVIVTKYPPIPSPSSLSSDSAFSIITYSAYSSLFQTIFMISSNHSLYILNTSSSQYGMYALDSSCESITIINSTLYLACQYQKINYVSQIAIVSTLPQQQSNSTISIQLILNRYYDQSILQGIRDVQPLGYNRIALIGDQAVVVIGQAVNRNILTQLQQQQDIQQNYDNANSFGMIDYYYIQEYSTKEQSTVLVIGDKSVYLVTVIYYPPQVQCVFSREQFGTTITLLVVFNTTQCPYQPQSDQNIPAWQSVCQAYYPIQINLGAKEYQQKTAKLIIFLIIVFLVAFTLICAGCGVKIRNRANFVIQSIKKKIQNVKKQGKRKRRV